MDKEFLKEKISLLKDLWRGLFALFILIGSGAATLWARKSFIIHDVPGKIILKYNIDFYTWILCLVLDFIILAVIFIVYYRINNIVKKLE